jgi:hypothetical protein
MKISIGIPWLIMVIWGPIWCFEPPPFNNPSLMSRKASISASGKSLMRCYWH